MPFKQMKELSVFFENVKITRSDLNRLLCEFRSLMTISFHHCEQVDAIKTKELTDENREL